MKDLTQGNIYKNFFLFSIPIVLSSLLSSAFGVINTAIAGRFLGAEGMAATDATSAFVQVVDAIFWGHAYGLSVYAANLFGAKDYDRLKRTLYGNITLTVAAAALLAVVSIIFSDQILGFLKVDQIIWEDAKLYFRMLLVQMIIALCSHMFMTCCHSMGETAFPLIISFGTAGLTVIGNLFVVAVLDLGVMGMGIVTILVTLVGNVCYWLRFRKYFVQLGVGSNIPKFEWKDIKPLFSFSLPNIFQQGSLYVASLLVAPVTNGLGYLVTATVSASNRIRNMHSSLYYSASKTAGNYIAQCVGAKKHTMIKKAVKVALVQGVAFFLFMFIPVYIFPEFVAGLFVKQSEEPQVFEYVLMYIRVFLPFVFLHVFCGIFHSILRGIKSNIHLIISSFIGAFGNMIFAWILAPTYGLKGVFAATVLGWGMECIYVFCIVLTGFWVPKSIRANVLGRRKDLTEQKDKT